MVAVKAPDFFFAIISHQFSFLVTLFLTTFYRRRFIPYPF